MSAANSIKLKENCDAVVSSGSFINQSNFNSSIVINSTPSIKTSLHDNSNNGANLNKSSINKFVSPVSSIVESSSQPQPENINDVQKVLKQEQELQKQLYYSGSNVAPGWLRVNHNNKVIYIR